MFRKKEDFEREYEEKNMQISRVNFVTSRYKMDPAQFNAKPLPKLRKMNER